MEESEVYKKQVDVLEKKLALYEQNGAAKLFYSLNRKMNEMADLMNKTNLSQLLLDDPKDKTFERLKVIWNDAASIATAVKSLGESAGVTNDEKKDVEKKPFNERIALDRN
jgi:hypothetical protein